MVQKLLPNEKERINGIVAAKSLQALVAIWMFPSCEILNVFHIRKYETKKSKIELNKTKEAAEKKKKANLTTKYETRNAMSSLLDVVDEHDKRMKSK